jgi:hypothetical protein
MIPAIKTETLLGTCDKSHFYKNVTLENRKYYQSLKLRVFLCESMCILMWFIGSYHISHIAHNSTT